MWQRPGNLLLARAFASLVSARSSLAMPPLSVTPGVTPATLEELAYYYGTDKSRDDHKYVDLYAALFDPIRHSVRNVTEVGVATGQSLQVWHDYFDRASIWGIELHVLRSTWQIFAMPQWADRVHVLKGNSRSSAGIDALHLANESMDVIIDDGEHTSQANELTLIALWRTLRPGGYYLIEDIPTGTGGEERFNGVRHGTNRSAGEVREGTTPLVHSPETWSRPMHDILTQHDAFFVDTAAGHRNFEGFVRQTNRGKNKWGLDRLNHNSHVLVIRKRAMPLTAPVRIHTGVTAMKGGASTRPPLNLTEFRASMEPAESTGEQGAAHQR